jgi:acyl-CoA synthetase (AMP-forming)/AMP-acid ligase II
MTVRQIGVAEHRTVVAALRVAARENADVEAYVEPAAEGATRRSMTFSQWDRAADGVAGVLADQGVAKGDVVAMVLPSCIDFAVNYAALQRLGAITSAVNPRLGQRELTSIFERTQPVATIVDSGLGVGLPPESGVVIDRARLHAAQEGPPPSSFPDLDGEDPVAVVWTSGTTGHPKGALFDHRNLAAVALGTDVLSQPGDRRLSPLPFAHVGYMTRMWDEVAHGVTTVITPTPWRPIDAIRIMVQERISVAQGVPTQWALILACEELDQSDLGALRIAGTGAARISAAQVAEMQRRLGVPVVVRYTSTETSLGTGTVPGDPNEVVANTVGRPVPGVEIALVDENDVAVPTGEVGRVRLRSGAVMQGYFADQRLVDPSRRARERPSEHLIDHDATAPVRSADGWITTGDLGCLDEAGNLHLVGRSSEMYIRGGYNIYPAEVEEALADHPVVAQSAVVGTPDPVLGEVGIAFIVLAPGVTPEDAPQLAELRAHCAAQLADYKAPDAVIVLEAMPLTAMMKVDKRALAPLAAQACPRRVSQGDPASLTGEPVPSPVNGRTD